MPVYEYGGERVEAVQYSKFSDHPYLRQLHPGEFPEELPPVPDPRPTCAALDQPGGEPVLVRQSDMIISRPAEHGELTCEVVPAADFLGKAKLVGVPDPQLTAGMSASPEHQELRARRIDEDLDRQVAAREQREQDAEAKRQSDEKNPPEINPPAAKQTSGEPGSPQAAVRGRQGQDGTPHDKREREAKPQPAGADGNRSTKADEPDPDAARHHKVKAR